MSLEKDEGFQRDATNVAMVQKLQVEIEELRGRAAELTEAEQESIERMNEQLEGLEPQLKGLRDEVGRQDKRVLELKRCASEDGVKVARQTMIEEYFAAQ